ncbi:PP2C family protein-serine/threonine phosphatase [Streptomyces sp. GC420]|uniref:PP2C family protein-serine/threonine phosphatase n=1 Tax=Streptomyces sp. GC420 TaxID=2697568 RepID=UPI001414EC66|nr:PP2C family protein-serine/threonine phosphatase [Streptomyces sp. GC420]NBM17207.1 SpoIIE family protein phosphatase [Streptomyces sp. GC420]
MHDSKDPARPDPAAPDPAANRHGGGGGQPVSVSWRFVLLGLAGVTLALTVTGIVIERVPGLSPFLVVLPALLAGWGSARQTLAASVWVTLVVAGSLVYSPLDSIGDTLSVIVFAILFNGISVLRAEQRIHREREIARLRSAAAALQRQILRPFPLMTGQLVVHGLYEPVEEDSRVGGDIYEVVDSPYGSRVFIGDVQGKGLAAIGAAYAVLSAFRESALAEPTLTSIVDRLEQAVLWHNSFAAQVGDRERFVTALVLGVGPGSEAQAVNCGHVPPYLLHDGRTGPVLRREPGVPLGLGPLTQEPRTVEWFDFPEGATLLLCTDGVTEARDPEGAFYPLEERVGAWRDVRPLEVTTTLRRELEEHTRGSATDDRAVLVLRRRTTAGPA